MKLKLSYLRKILRESISYNDYAVYIRKTDDRIKIIVYKPNELDVVTFEDTTSGIVGMIEAKRKTIAGSRVLPCNGAWQVIAAAGDGKLMYNLMYSIVPSKTLMSDRANVSSAAYTGWSKQFDNKRPSKELDNYLFPQTPDPDDDCIVYPKHDSRSVVLNRSYKKTIDFPISEMQLNHIKFCKYIADEFMMNQTMTERIINDAGEAFFDQNYSGYGQ